MLPGEVFERLYSEGFHLIQVLIADAPSHRLQNLAVQLCEVNIEEGGFHVELDSKGPVAEQKVKGQFMDNVSAEEERSENGQTS